MLAAAAARLRERRDLVWVDLGGGTGVSKQLQALQSRLQQPVSSDNEPPAVRESSHLSSAEHFHLHPLDHGAAPPPRPWLERHSMTCSSSRVPAMQLCRRVAPPDAACWRRHSGSWSMALVGSSVL